MYIISTANVKGAPPFLQPPLLFALRRARAPTHADFRSGAPGEIVDKLAHVQTPARTSIRFLSTRPTKNMYGGNRIASTSMPMSMPKSGETHAGNGRGGRDVCGERNKQIIRGSYRARTEPNARDMKRRVAADCPRMPIVNGNGPNGISDYWRYAKSTRTEVSARARARYEPYIMSR